MSAKNIYQLLWSGSVSYLHSALIRIRVKYLHTLIPVLPWSGSVSNIYIPVLSRSGSVSNIYRYCLDPDLFQIFTYRYCLDPDPFQIFTYRYCLDPDPCQILKYLPTGTALIRISVALIRIRGKWITPFQHCRKKRKKREDEEEEIPLSSSLEKVRIKNYGNRMWVILLYCAKCSVI